MSFRDKLHIYLLGCLTTLILCLGVWYFWPKKELTISKPASVVRVQVPALVDTNEIREKLTPEIYARAKREAEAEFRKRVRVLPSQKCIPETKHTGSFNAIKPEAGPPILCRGGTICTTQLTYKEPVFNMDVFLWTHKPVLSSAMTYELNMREIQHLYPTELKIANIATGVLLAGILYTSIRNW